MSEITTICKKCGRLFHTTIIGEGEFECPHCGTRYLRVYDQEEHMYEFYPEDSTGE